MVKNSNAKVDKTWKEGIVINKSNVFSNDRDIKEAFVEDPIRQSFFGKTLTDTTIQNFEGVSMSGFLPPDTDGDVGLIIISRLSTADLPFTIKMGIS